MDALSKARRGSKSAFKTLFDSYGQQGYGYLVKMTGDRKKADELFKNLWLKAYHDISSITRDFSYWYYQALLETVERYFKGMKQSYLKNMHYRDVEWEYEHKIFMTMSPEQRTFMANRYLNHHEEVDDICYEVLSLFHGTTYDTNHKHEELHEKQWQKLDEKLQVLFKPMTFSTDLEDEIMQFVVKKRPYRLFGIATVVILRVSFFFLYQEMLPWGETHMSSVLVPEIVDEIDLMKDVEMTFSDLTLNFSEFSFDVIPSVGLDRDVDYELNIYLPGVSKDNYRLDYENGVFHFEIPTVKSLFYRKEQTVNLALYVNGELVKSSDHVMKIGDFRNLHTVMPIHQSLTFEPLVMHFEDLTVERDLMTLRYKMDLHTVDDLMYIDWFLVDDLDNYYYSNRRNYDGEYYLAEIDNRILDPSASTLTFGVRGIYFLNREEIGQIHDGQLDFVFDDISFYLRVIGDNKENRVTMSTDEPVSEEYFKRLEAKTGGQWFSFHMQPNIQTFQLTAEDFKAVYDIPGDQVEDLQPLIDYIFEKYQTRLDEESLGSMLKWLPEYNEVAIITDDLMLDHVEYISYFGNLEGLPLAMVNDYKEYIVVESFTYEIIR